MKSKKIVSSYFFLFFGILGIVIILETIPLMWNAISSHFVSREEVVNFVMYAVGDLLILTFMFGLNRLAFWVWYENGVIKSRGLFFGFKKEVRVEDITKIEIVTFFKDGAYFVLIDGKSRNGYDRVKKDSFIFIPQSQKNRQFIRTFWKGRIGNYIEKENDPWA